MAEGSEEQNRSEEATPFKLERARAKGSVARGMDLGFFASLGIHSTFGYSPRTISTTFSITARCSAVLGWDREPDDTDNLGCYRDRMERGDDQGGFRRIIYTSQAAGADFLGILKQSRANNGVDGISGLLAFDGSEFVQVLEGPPESVEATFNRIARDPRHTDIRVVLDTIESERAFGDWTMAGLPDEQEEIVRDRLKTLLRRVPTQVREAFSPGMIPYPHPPAG